MNHISFIHLINFLASRNFISCVHKVEEIVFNHKHRIIDRLIPWIFFYEFVFQVLNFWYLLSNLQETRRRQTSLCTWFSGWKDSKVFLPSGKNKLPRFSAGNIMNAFINHHSFAMRRKKRNIKDRISLQRKKQIVPSSNSHQFNVLQLQ